jgi:hypothetical protein
VPASPARELRLALTTKDYESALRYRDALGLPVVSEWERPSGSGAILDAGRTTVELLSVKQTELVEEVEAGKPGVSGPVRIALETDDSVETAERLVAAIMSGERPS